MPISVTPKINFNVKGRGGGRWVIRGRGSVRPGRMPVAAEWYTISVAIISST